MSPREAREILWMRDRGAPLYSGPMERGDPEPAIFTEMVDRGLWKRLPGKGYVPTAQAIEDAERIVASLPKVTRSTIRAPLLLGQGGYWRDRVGSDFDAAQRMGRRGG